MELPAKIPSSFTLNHWREKVKTLAENIFAPPYLPSKFILFFLLTNITHFAVMVTNYSPSYWRGSFKAAGFAPSDVWETTPLQWLIFAALYLSMALFCLTVFNYRWSFIGWLVAEIVHFYGIGNWLTDCNYSRWSLAAGAFCESFDPKIFWIVIFIPMGFLFAANLYPRGNPLPQQKLDKGISLAAIFFSAAWSLLLLVGIAASAQKPTTGWVQLELERNPPPLQHAAHAYDTSRNTLVMFGGSTAYVNGRFIYKNETWEWDGKRWQNVSPPLKDSPQGRVSAAMAYDENRGVVVLYGGINASGTLCDTWEWNGEKWLGTCPPKCPGARYGHEMYYDPIHKKVVLHDGYDDKTFFHDAWEWDGLTWTQIEMQGDAPAASWFALAYNPDENNVFGLLSGFPGGTWMFQENRWTRLSPNIEPSNRGGTRLVYEPQRKDFFIFGGSSDDQHLNDTWFFDGKNWNQFTETTLQPSIRSNTVMWYDNIRKHVMLFGGENQSGVFNDTWELILPNEK